MEDKIKRLIFATSKIKLGHEAAAPKKAAYFVPTLQRNIAATAWTSGNTSKGITQFEP